MSSFTDFRLGVPHVMYGSTRRSMFIVALLTCAAWASQHTALIAARSPAAKPSGGVRRHTWSVRLSCFAR